MKLCAFQDAFVEALYQRPAPALADLAAQPAFAVYRNTVLKGCVDALCANFPSVERLVGTPWMRAAASNFALQSPPVDARLACYGAAFPAFLDDLREAHQLPYLADVARLDHDWLIAFCASASPTLQLEALVGSTASDLANRHLIPHPGARWRWFDGQPIFSLWRHARTGVDWNNETPWQGQGALLVGSSEGVSYLPLELAGCVFLDACAAGHHLDSASHLALQVQADLDFTDLLGRLLRAGAFTDLA